MSSLPRRAGLVLAVVAAAIGLALPAQSAGAAVPDVAVSDVAAPDVAAPDVAAPEPAVRKGGRQTRARRLARQLRERQQSLMALNQRADAHERALVGRKAVLAMYGYTGDPDEVGAVLPLASYRVSAGFGLTGPLWEAEHGGQDFGASAGESIVAVAAGEVTEVGYSGPYGLRTVITLPDGTEIWYCHQTDVSVYAGQQVDVADQVGTVGSTGNSTGPHLHLEVRPAGGSPVDPMEWLRDEGLTP